MPRKQSLSATVNPDTSTPSTNGTGQHDLREELPDFTLPPEGVRPSERCGTPSPLGFSCEFRDEHTGRHSWQPAEAADDPKAAPGQAPVGAEVQDTGTDVEQGELPGTPEPEKTDSDIPTETQFAGKDFVSAPGLKAIADRLIANKDSLSVLEGLEVRYLWKRRGGTSGGNPKIGALQRPGGLLRYFSGGTPFVLWLAADHCRDLHLSPRQIEAAVFHQLLHADTNPEDDDQLRIRGHSFEGFVEELDEFGVWLPDLREMAAHVQALPLDVALAAAADQDDDEGEESE